MKLSVLLSGIVLLFCLGWFLFYEPYPATSSAMASKKSLSKGARKLMEQELGRKLFFDRNLSNPTGQSCASCHAPGKSFADPQQRAVSVGAAGDRFTTRNASAITYAAFTPGL